MPETKSKTDVWKISNQYYGKSANEEWHQTLQLIQQILLHDCCGPHSPGPAISGCFP